MFSLNYFSKAVIAIIFLFSNLLGQNTPPAILYLTLEESLPVIAASGSEAPAELAGIGASEGKRIWESWVRTADQDIRARLEQGDEDSIINLLLFGTSFTKQPRLTENQINRLAKERSQDVSQVFQSIMEARLNDFTLAITKPQGNERLAFAKDHIAKKIKININSITGRKAIQEFLVRSLQRVLNESAGFSSLIEQAQRNREDTFVIRSQLFSQRGLSSDTSLKPNFAIDKALAEIKEKGLISKIRRVAIIGPGLDFTDKDEGYDFYPPQTLQPFAVIESLLRLGLTDSNLLSIDTYDLSPKVNSHIANFALKAKGKEPYQILLPLETDKKYTPEFIKYWRNFGNQIALSSRAETTKNQPEIDVRTVYVRKEFLKKIRALDTNIVLQSPLLSETDRYDLIIGTNIFLYYNSFQQGLAMRNLNKMLKNGGVLLSNNALVEFPFTPVHSVGYTKAIYSERQNDADAIVWYQKKN